MKVNVKFSFVKDCGTLPRTIFKINDVYRLGCFEGTYDEAREIIIKKYENHELLDDYLEKLDLLRGGGQPMEEYNWKHGSIFIADYCPELIKEFPEKFNWKGTLFYLKKSRPEYLQYKPEDI